MIQSIAAKNLPKRLIEIPEMRRIQNLHFVGIGGAGMCGIAEVMLNQGYRVSGSDIKQSAVTNRLKTLGIEVFIGHDSQNIAKADVVVVSSAIDRNNPEIKAALKACLPVVRRADMLGELMRYRHGIAVAGAHGKTTTTSLLTMMMTEAGLDPTYVIGGKLNASGKNAALGQSRFLVAEADESDASFLSLRPMAAIVTNIDQDHMETYENSFDKLKAAYIQFLHNMPFYGLAVVCGDDPVLYDMIDDIARPTLTFGFKSRNHVQATDVKIEGVKTHFTVLRKNHDPLKLTLNIPGEHNVLNALAAITMASDEGVDDEAIKRALAKFAGVGRRFEQQACVSIKHSTDWLNNPLNDTEAHNDKKLDMDDVVLIDDYGHHPVEVAATIATARQSFPNRRIVMLFQPHRYSRTRDCFDEFVEVLSRVDKLMLLDVYSAGEKLIQGADTKALARSIRLRGEVEPIIVDKAELAPVMKRLLQGGDLLITQGAGNVGQISQELADNQLYLA